MKKSPKQKNTTTKIPQPKIKIQTDKKEKEKKELKLNKMQLTQELNRIKNCFFQKIYLVEMDKRHWTRLQLWRKKKTFRCIHKYISILQLIQQSTFLCAILFLNFKGSFVIIAFLERKKLKNFVLSYE